MRAVLATVMGVLAAGALVAAAPAPRPTSVLVLPVAAKAGVNKDLADLTTAAITNHASKVKGTRATALAEVEGLASQDQLKQAVGCDSVSCAAELAGALNADEIIMGNLGKFGASYLLTLTRVRARDAAIVGRSMQRIAGLNEDTLLDRLPVAVAELFDGSLHDPAAPPTAAPAPEPAAPAPAPAGDPGLPPGCERRFVSVLAALRLEKPDPQSPVRDRLVIGTELLVTERPLKTPAGTFWAVVSGGQGVGGFIKEADLSAAAPSFDAVMQAARSALMDADVVKSAVEGERAAALAPLQREPLDLLAAIYDAEANERSARRVRARLKDLKKVEEAKRAEEPEPAAEAPPVPAVGSTVFVNATRLRLREKPETSARVLADLLVNTPVKVLGTEGTWARVAWTRGNTKAGMAPSSVLELGTAAAAAPASGTDAPGSAEAVEGFVAAAFVAAAPASAETLVKEAAALETAGKRGEAVKRLARAAILAPTDVPLMKRLVKLAVEEKQYGTAAFTAVAIRNLGLGTLVELRLAFGCRGQRDRAVWTTETSSESLQSAMPDACVERVDPVGRCPPCAPPKPREDPNAERLAQAIASWQQASKSYETAQKRYLKWSADHEKEMLRLRESYASGPWLRAEVSGPTDAALRKQKLFAYALPISLQVERNNAPGVELARLQVSAQPAPWPDAGKRGVVWVHLPDYGASVYGLVAAPDAAAARAAVVRRLDKQTPETEGAVSALAPQPNVLGPMMQCGCAGN